MFNKTILKVFTCCCASAFLMEILMSRAPQCTLLITCLQFLLVTVKGFIFTTKFLTVKSKIPVKEYFLLVALFFVTSVSNNYVYYLHVPSTLHMIIRSASTPASMLVSWHAKKQAPKLSSAVGSLLISVGVLLAMYGGATVAEQQKGTFFYWCIGVGILLTTLVTGAYTGLQQELLYTKYGKHPDEMMFYTYAIPLPMFMAMYPQMAESTSSLQSDTWVLIAVNIMCQYYCTNSVHVLSTKETSVTINLILTLRKFMSLLISSIVFKNNITYLHVVGSVLVMIGTFIYFDCFTSRKQRPVTAQDWRKNK
ncbi:unnamed protein product [Plutella xylostella]|uniref:(diamondback moth) hypothetical protein n=1 Tax=Plutella xylostella TaxID=51655 RepID=A0A8S4E2Z9_PLUXY|nr:unnamed protein product [Plutella xylostella]